MTKRKTAILSAGELLVDMISADFAETLDQVNNFKRIPGGSPANLCMNMARLGHKSRLVASVGKDDMGNLLKKYVSDLGVDCAGVAQNDEPTTLILVTRSAGVSNFEAYRSADSQLSIRQFPYQLFSDISFFHTSCFALSKNPAQSVILEAAEKANRAGCNLSIDVNYAAKIWPDFKEARKVVSEYIRMGAYVKVSDVDWTRLYGEMSTKQAVLDHFLMSGAKEVCLTLGSEGCWVANESETHFLPSRTVEVKDTTGAGDAFWAGYLSARIDEKSILQAAMAGRKLAEIKLGHFGPLPNSVARELIYEDFTD